MFTKSCPTGLFFWLLFTGIGCMSQMVPCNKRVFKFLRSPRRRGCDLRKKKKTVKKINNLSFFFPLQGGPPPSTVSQSAPATLPGNLPSSSPYTMPPEPTLSQNPLSIMMSRMSKFAMPSSTPLYHDAIKTVASSDDDSPPARSPNLPPMNSVPGKKLKEV